MKKRYLLTFIFILSGCATQIMSGFIGKPITAVINKYGFPSGAYDVDQNKRAFVWQMNGGVIVPGNSFTNASVAGNQIFASTYSSPSYVSSFSCSYVMIAENNKLDIQGPAAWTVVGYEKPSFGCN